MKKINLLFIMFLTISLLSVLSFGQNELKVQKKGFVKKIDHIVFMPGDSKGLYNFMVKDLELPISWKYQSYGDFESGGVYAGNVVLESEAGNYKDIKTDAKITGLAFEMENTTDKVIKELNKRKIGHGKPIPYFMGKGKNKIKTWTIMFLNNLIPGSGVFTVEYHFPKGSQDARAKSFNEILKKKNGGPAGIVLVKHITIMVKNMSNAKTKWLKFLSPSKNKKDYFSIGTGPGIIIKKSEKDYIHSISFKVNSLKKTVKFLKNKNISGVQKKDIVYSDPKKTFGILLEFAE